MNDTTSEVVIELPNGAGPKRFEHPGAFKAWLKEERDYWSFLSAAQQPQTWNLYVEAFDGALRRWVPNADANTVLNIVDRIRARFIDEPKFRSLIFRDSPKGEFIQTLRASLSPSGTDAAIAEAGAAAAMLVGLAVENGTSPAAHRGVRRAMDYLAGRQSEVALGATHFDHLSKEIRGWFHEQRHAVELAVQGLHETRTLTTQAYKDLLASTKADREEGRAQLESLTELARRQSDSMLSAATTKQDEAQARLLSMMEDATRASEYMLAENSKRHAEAFEHFHLRVDSLEKALATDIASRKPVEYWDNKRKLHMRLAIAFGALFVVGLGIAGLGLYKFFELLLVPAPLAPNATATWMTLFPLANIAKSIVVLMLVVWVLRILARLFLSNVHLNTDAAERVAMTKTYIALLAEGGAATNDDKRIVLEALFRRGSTGIFREDANVPMLELLQRGAKG